MNFAKKALHSLLLVSLGSLAHAADETGFEEPPYAPTGLYLMSGFASSPDLNGLLVYCDRGDSGEQDTWCRNFDVHAELAGAQVEFSGVSLGTLNPSEVYPAVVGPDYSRGELVKVEATENVQVAVQKGWSLVWARIDANIKGRLPVFRRTEKLRLGIFKSPADGRATWKWDAINGFYQVR